MKLRQIGTWLAMAAWMCVVGAGHAAETLRIHELADPSKVIPIHVSGYSGTVESVLRFDLAVAGFEHVPAGQAKFVLSPMPNAASPVSGILATESKAELLRRAYSGSGERAMAHALANDVILAITGQKGIAGTKIAFRLDLGRDEEIAVADYDGFGMVPITRDASLAKGPSWIPGRREVVYASWRLGSPQILHHNLGTGERRAILSLPGGCHSPTVSPDGRKVAFISARSGSPDLYVANLDGSGLTRLTHTREDESSPTWSPDGKTICYTGRAGGRSVLFTVPAAGGEPKRLETTGVLNATEPDWSPDGKWILFTTQRGGFEICLVPATGGSAVPLGSGEDPSWAPNSRTAVFVRRVGDARVLSLLDVPTKRVRDLQRISGNCSQPSWAQ